MIEATAQTDYRNRPQKRRALTETLEAARPGFHDLREPFIYLTLGAEEILDVPYLLKVCYYEDIAGVVSFERDERRAEVARQCLIAQIFNRWHREPAYTNKLEVIAEDFPGVLSRLASQVGSSPVVAFLDYTGWFKLAEGSAILDLMKRGLLRQGSILLITSSQGQHGWGPLKERFVEQYAAATGNEADDRTVRANVVELTLAETLRQYNHNDAYTNDYRRQLGLECLCKVRYQDMNHVEMGLWCYRVVSGGRALTIPTHFDYEFLAPLAPEGPDLFGDLF